MSESGAIEFKKRFRKDAYSWIEETLGRFHYVILSKKEKGLIRRYLMKITGYSRVQLTRHIAQYRKTGQVRIKEYVRNKFKKKYTFEDIRLLDQIAQIHSHPNGAVPQKTLERMASVYQKEEYQNIAHISGSHTYTWRKNSLPAQYFLLSANQER